MQCWNSSYVIFIFTKSVDYVIGKKVCGSMLGVIRQPCFVLKRVHPFGIQECKCGSLASPFNRCKLDRQFFSNVLSFLTCKLQNLHQHFSFDMPLNHVDCAMTNHLFQVVEKHLSCFLLILIRCRTVLLLHCWTLSFQYLDCMSAGTA